MKDVEIKKDLLKALMGKMDSRASSKLKKEPLVVVEAEIEPIQDPGAIAEEVYTIATGEGEKGEIINKIMELIESYKK